MKKSGQGRRAAQDAAPPGPPPDKVGWVRQFCGRGLFREIWKNRFLLLRGELLWVSAREVRDERGAQHVLEMLNFDRCEELKKEKSRSKKSHSRFTLIRRSHTPNTIHSLVFLALSPEEKESWIQALNSAISRTKTRSKDPILDQVVLEDGALVHPTRERVRIPPGRRLPSRGHLLAVASSSQGCLTLDLVAEEESGSRGSWERGVHVDCRVVGGRQRAGTDVSKLRPSSRETRVKTGSLPRASERNWGRGEPSKVLKNRSHIQVFKGQSRTPQPGKKLTSQGRNRCASMDEVLSSRPALIRSELRSALKRCPSEEQQPVGQLQSLIAQRMQRAQELLEEMRLQELQKNKTQRERTTHKNSPKNQTKTQNQSRSRSGGSGSPRVQRKDSPQSKSKKTKIRTNMESAKPKDQAKPNHSPSVKDKDKLSKSPSRTDKAKEKTKSSQSPILKDQTIDQQKSCQSPGLKQQTSQSSSLRIQTSFSPTHHTQSDSKYDESTSSSPKDDPPETPETCRSTITGPEIDFDQDPDPEETLELETCEETQELHQDLEEVLEEESDLDLEQDSGQGQGVQEQRAEAERLLQEALCSWRQAQEVLKEVRELQSQTLRRQRRKTYREQDQGTDQDPGPEGLNQDPALNQVQAEEREDPDQEPDMNLSMSHSENQDKSEDEPPAEMVPATKPEERPPEKPESSEVDS